MQYNNLETISLTPQFIAGNVIDSFGLLGGVHDVVKCNGINSSENSAAWPAANRAIFTPISVPITFIVKTIYWVNGTISGNIDAGIYNFAGTRLASIGTTAQAGSGLLQSASLSIVLTPGIYFLAMAMDNATGTISSYAGLALTLETAGVQQMAAAFVLPSTATFANPASNFVPAIGISQLSVV